jgi:TfoX/Sxy family transcriptional regulator of competence genes
MGPVVPVRSPDGKKLRRIGRPIPKESPMKRAPKRKSPTHKARHRDTAEIAPSFAPVVAAFAGNRKVIRKRMFSSENVLTVQGKIFAMFSRGKFVAKLPKERVDEIVSAGEGERFNPGHGRLMKEWVALEEKKESWVALAHEAYEFVKAGKL